MQEQGQDFEELEPGNESGTESQRATDGKDTRARRAKILAGLTVGTLVITAVAVGDPTPTMASWA
ncbi:hypothetical protein ACIRPX_17830 [Streptomyces sp. NPDC101225]|uniref:hypothetical protein n=1 Tax=Streptomyces sp. NPDC101225 TaxID=3366135 RepID=UPI00381D60E4